MINQTVHLTSLHPHLTKQDQIFVTCFNCLQSQQQCQNDILIDAKCHMHHVCYPCYTKLKNEFMTQCACKQKLKDHIKYKNTKKQYILDEGSKMYQKQYKIRSSWQQLDSQFVNLLAYYYRNGRGNQYGSKERQLKNILKDLKKKQNLIFGDLKKMKIPQFVNRENNDATGKDACGYVSNYEKGLKFLFDSFGF